MRKFNNKIKRKLRNRKKLKDVNTDKFRISITKSLKNLSAQIIDDKNKRTLVSVSSTEKEVKNKKIKKMEKSNLIGEIFEIRPSLFVSNNIPENVPSPFAGIKRPLGIPEINFSSGFCLSKPKIES